MTALNDTNLLLDHSREIRLRNGTSIFLGSYRASKSWKALREANVDAIVNITTNVPNSFPNHFDYYTLRLPDWADAPLLQHLDEVTAFIHRHIANQKNVLVHCCRGTSRSVAVLWAYLVRYDEDRRFAASLLGKVNPGLLQQVHLYQEHRCGSEDDCAQADVLSCEADKLNNAVSLGSTAEQPVVS